jgi:hypothetical protein
MVVLLAEMMVATMVERKVAMLVDLTAEKMAGPTAPL